MKPLVEGKDYTLIGGVLKINEGVRHIPKFSFVSNSLIKTIIFPSTLISIGCCAFYLCINLKGPLIIPDSVKYIGQESFRQCGATSLSIGKGVEYIGNTSFYLNPLSKINIQSTNLKYIGTYAFFNEESEIKEFNMKSSLVLIGGSTTFSGGSKSLYYRLLEENKVIDIRNANICTQDTRDKYSYTEGVLTINDGVQVIGEFSDFILVKEIIIPDSVLIIDRNAFSNYSNLKKVRFSNNLLEIRSGAFERCKLRYTELDLPDSLCTITDETAFDNNYGDEKISIPYHASVCVQGYTSPKFIVRPDNIEYIQKNQFNISNLVEEDRKLIQSVGLLPEVINNNKILNNNISESLSKILKNSLLELIKNTNYDEKTMINDVSTLLNIKAVDISDMHETINYLFDKNQISTIYLFIKYGYDYHDNSMIARAIINKMNDMIEILLIIGADIDEIGPVKMTPLSVACQNGDIELVRYLIEKGAALNKVDSNNKTAIDYAREKDHDEIVELLSSYSIEQTETQKDLETITKLLKQ